MSKFWGSRFDGETDNLADVFSFSIDYDYKLALYDVIGSQAHAKMLGETGIIPKKDSQALIKGLKQIQNDIESGKYKYDPKEEDIHSDIQSKLKKLIGSAADRLHTARSRNDLVVLDMRMYCKDQIKETILLLSDLQRSIVGFAEENKETVIPAYTHLQSAQLVDVAHHMLAYVEMIERDKSRLTDAFNRMNQMPLGSCALSGTSLPTNRKMVADELDFAMVTRNSIDSVSDRDFIADTLYSLSMISMHYSRIAEDLIIWATSEFNYVDIDWSMCTGSSIMPHKKNPDILELIRGETATLYANLNQLMVLLKGLPLTYNRDLQLDKPALFQSVEKAKIMTQLLAKLFATLKLKRENIAPRTEHESFFSVDIMDYLIRKGVSYRDAHDTVGVIIKECVDKGKSINDLSKTELQKFHAKLHVDVKKLLSPENSVKIKISEGSTGPKSVNKQIKFWKKVLSNA